MSNQGWHTLYARPGFNEADSLDVRAVGDVMLGRYVAPVLQKHDPDWLFQPVAELLQGDLVLGNLESPLTLRQATNQLRPGPFRLPAAPALVSRLAPFDALSLANNHALDAGPEGLADAYRALNTSNIEPLGIKRCGTPLSLTPNPQPLTPRVLAYNDVHDPADQPDETNGCGRAWLDDHALKEIAAHAGASNQPIIVLVHWGDEYATKPNVRQREWATKLVAAGADLVIGAHPHVVQPAEMVQAGGRQGYVAYSLGNFVFDQPNQAATSHSVVLRAWLGAEGVGKVAVAPVRIVNGRPQPLPLDDPAAQAQIIALVPLTTQTATPTVLSTSSDLHAWRWDGTTYSPVPVPAGTLMPAQPQMLNVDLRGNGEPLQATLDQGLVQVRQGNKVVWRNEEPAWNVAGMTSGDADNDGRYEILLRLWKPDQQGVLRSHPFLMGWRGNYYRIFWGGSAVAAPIQDAAIGPVSGNRNALVVAAGGSLPGDPADHIGVWTWQGWNFQEQWRSAPGVYRQVTLLDLDGDGVMEIVAQ